MELMATSRRTTSYEDEMFTVFRIFDKDDDGRIDATDIRATMKVNCMYCVMTDTRASMKVLVLCRDRHPCHHEGTRTVWLLHIRHYLSLSNKRHCLITHRS